MMTHHYSLYDFTLQSPIALPSLPKVTSSETKATVTIEFGRISPTGLDNPLQRKAIYQIGEHEFWLNLPTVARFLVLDGQRIIIDPIAKIDEDSIRTFLFTVCIEVLLKQRQLSVLPGFALNIQQQGVGFTGLPGFGQTMLQSLFYKREYTFLSGNNLCIDQDQVLPGLGHMELNESIARALAIDVQNLSPARAAIQRYFLPIQHHPHALPLSAIYTLKMHQQPEIMFSSLNEEHKIPYLNSLLRTNTAGIDLWYAHHALPDLSQLNEIPLIGIHLPSSGLKMQQVLSAIEQDLAQRSHSYA